MKKKTIIYLIVAIFMCTIVLFGVYLKNKSNNIEKSTLGTSSTNINAYTIELSRWEISNDFSNSINTSKGINAALKWAKESGYMEVVLPVGKYLIEKNTPIEPPADIVFDLGGATLKIEDNELQKYRVIYIAKDQSNVTIKNGNVIGDRDTHDYAAIKGTHEWGTGIEVYGKSKNIDIENIKLYNFTGDGIGLSFRYNYIDRITAANMIEGSIDNETGAFVNSSGSIRTTKKMTFSNSLFTRLNYFGLYGNGYSALPGVKTDFFNIYFYDINNNYIGYKEHIRFYEEMDIPAGTNYYYATFNQDLTTDFSVEYRAPEVSKDIYIRNCEIYNNRRQGISVCGAKNVYIENNIIHDINGTAPEGGIDIEDGYEINQYIYIYKNNLYNNNGYDIVVVDGRWISIDGNKIRSLPKYAGLAINPEVEYSKVINNNFNKTKAVILGDCIFSGNTVTASIMSLGGKSLTVSDSLMYNSLLILQPEIPYGIKLDNIKVYNDEKKKDFPNLWASITLSGNPIEISNSVIEGKDRYYAFDTRNEVKEGFIFRNVTFNDLGILALPNGIYSNCKFLRNNQLDFRGSGECILENSYIEVVDVGVTVSRNSSMLTIKNNMFNFIEGVLYHKSVISINNGQVVIVEGNIIKASKLTTNKTIFIDIKPSFNGESVVIQNNMFDSNMSCIAIDTSKITSSIPYTITNNTLLGGCIIKDREIDNTNNNYEMKI
jgi:hypothetical protein